MRALVGLSLLLAGCSGAEARTFAATLLDDGKLSCAGITRHAGFEQEMLDAIAEDFEDAHEESLIETPPRPIGRVLRILERDHEVQAWFDVQAATSEPVAFAHAGVVYRGTPQDGFIEGRFALLFNHDAADEKGGFEACGERATAEGVLSLTEGDGVQGRIRWRERTFIGTAPSRCLAWIECARSITVDGLPLGSM